MDSGCSLAEIVDCGCGLRPLSRLKPLPQFLEPLPGIPSRLKPLPQFLEPLPGILSRLNEAAPTVLKTSAWGLSRLKPLLQFLKPLPGILSRLKPLLQFLKPLPGVCRG